MTTHYKIELLKSNTALKLTYKAGKFHRIERLRGKLTDPAIFCLGKILPPREDELDRFSKEFPDIRYTQIVKEKSQFAKFNDRWFAFYENFTGLTPKFGAADGMHLKKIIKHLETVGGSQSEALKLWETILATWPKLSEFHRENTDLKYINSRLNVLLNAVKKAINGKTTATGADSSASL